MSRLAILASVVAVAVISVACAETGGPSNSANSMLTGPSAFGASMDGAAVSVPTAKGGNGKGKFGDATSGSISGIEVSVDANGDGVPNFGDHVTFTVSTNATSPFISVTCYQGSSWVYAAGGYSAGSEFTLSGNSWPGGAADCTARLYTTTDGTQTTTLATYPFHVY